MDVPRIQKHFQNLETRPAEPLGVPHSDNLVSQDLVLGQCCVNFGI